MQRSTWKPSLADRLAVKHFCRHLPPDQRRSFSRAVAAKIDADDGPELDRVTQGHLVFACCLICSVEQWQAAGLYRAQAKAQVRKAVLAYGRRASKLVMWFTARFSKDPFAAIAKYSEEKTVNGYGPTFDIAHVEHEAGFKSVVKRCGYRAILARHDADDLIDLFCAWDKVWIDALPDGIAFRRPQTLAQGDEICSFEFTRR